MTQQDICVIAPTVRNPEFIREYVANARENGFDTDRMCVVLVTEDFCDKESMRGMLDELGVVGEVFGGTERDAWYERKGIE